MPRFNINLGVFQNPLGIVHVKVILPAGESMTWFQVRH